MSKGATDADAPFLFLTRKRDLSLAIGPLRAGLPLPAAVKEPLSDLFFGRINALPREDAGDAIRVGLAYMHRKRPLFG